MSKMMPIFIDKNGHVLKYEEAWDEVENKFAHDADYFKKYAKTELSVEYLLDYLEDMHPGVYDELIGFETGLSFIDSCDECGDKMLRKYFGLRRIYPESPEYSKYIGSNAKKPAAQKKQTCHGASCKCRSCAAKKKKKTAAPKRSASGTGKKR